MVSKKQLLRYISSLKGLTDIGLGFFEDFSLNTRRNTMVDLRRSQKSLGQNPNLHQIATNTIVTRDAVMLYYSRQYHFLNTHHQEKMTMKKPPKRNSGPF